MWPYIATPIRIWLLPSSWLLADGVTKADTAGRYVLKDIPAGIYTVVTWHKFAGTFRRVVRIGPEGDAELDIVLPYVDPPTANHLANR